MTYPEALEYLNEFTNYEKLNSYDYNRSFRLDRMRKLSSLLGDPQKGIKSIHVAGTKGKGSTCAITYSILRKSGFKVGLYTSPHLSSFCERIRINEAFIKEEDVGRLLDNVKGALSEMGAEAPSFFEVYTAIAYLYFKENAVDLAVYEVGLGGRLDATNIIEPLVCAITPISYEHTDKLGHTLREIAYEKAGIIKDGLVCVTAPQEEEAMETIKDVCKRKNAKLVVVGRDIKFKELESAEEKEVFNVSGMAGEYLALETKLLGAHQVINAATAVGIVESLGDHGIAVSPKAIRVGIASARWDGRLEVVSKRPHIVLDGAQNAASARALADSVKTIFKYKKLILALGVSSDKDIEGILKELLPITDSVVLTKSRIAERSLDPARMKALITSKNSVVTSNVEEAVRQAKSKAGAEDLILITGSLFVVGEAREILTGSGL
ncbi:MAG: folylpolyglutamate synthase/dihydrofolate synthase family protein [Candidatus Omnitrophota bacterium]